MYTAIINAVDICTNAMESITGAQLIPADGEKMLVISREQYLDKPLGKRWDGNKFVAFEDSGNITPPPEPPTPPSPLPNIITKVAMLTKRLKTSEFVDILTAAKTDPAVEAWKYVFDAATVVDLDSQNTKDGMALLVAKGLLMQTRATAILTDPVQPEERP